MDSVLFVDCPPAHPTDPKVRSVETSVLSASSAVEIGFDRQADKKQYDFSHPADLNRLARRNRRMRPK